MAEVAVAAAAAVVVAVSGGCAGQPSGESRSADGVLGCADTAAWGQVKAVTPEGSRLRVVVQTERWVVPSQGAKTVEFSADDPSVEVDAPAWRPGDRGLLVLDESSPPALYAGDIGAELEKAWRDAGSRRLADCQA